MIALAIDCSTIVLPAFGGDTISAALALADRHDQVDDPGGEDVRLGLQPQPLLRVQRGQLVELGPVLASSGSMPLTVSSRTSALYLSLRSPSRGWRTAPVIASPRRSPYRRTCDSET